MGYNRSGCLSGGTFLLYFLLLFSVVLLLGFCFRTFPLQELVGVGVNRSRQHRLYWLVFVGHFSADSMMETQDIVGLEGTKLCFYDTFIITSLLDTSVRTKSHCNCR